MFRNKLSKCVALGLSLFMLGASMCPVFAATSYVNSTGSVTGDISAGTKTGQDTNQSKQSTYSGDITADATEACEVYATKASTFSVVIPKTVIMSGQKDASKGYFGEYAVTVKGDIAGDETVTVAPASTVALHQDNKADVTANITQAKKTWKIGDGDVTEANVQSGTGIDTTGMVAVDEISAGSWSGSFNFDISINGN